MASAGSIFVDLNLKDANFRSGLNRATNDVKKSTSNMASNFNLVAASAAGAFAALATGSAITSFISNTIKAEQEQAQLAAALESTGYAAGYTQQQLNAMAASLSQRSIFSGGEITNAQVRLLSYVGILGENLPRAMQAVIDQSARLGISVEQSAETIGRALEQPSKAAAALSRQGFGSYFTKETVEILKSLEAQGKAAEAQVMILEVLEESYAGAAEAARNTLGGALINLNNAIADISTRDGGIPFLTKLINDFADSLRQASADSSLLETLIYGLGAIAIETAIKFNELSLAVSNKTNLFGINDDDIEIATRNIAALEQRLDDISLRLANSKTPVASVDFSSPSLPGLGATPRVSEDSIRQSNRELENLNRLYERHADIIRGVSQETLKLEEVERNLNTLHQSGRISYDELTVALQRYKDGLNTTGSQMDEFAKQASRNIQDSFADFLFNPFDEGLKGMLRGFVDTLRQMIAQAAAAKIGDYLLGDGNGASGSVGVLRGPLESFFGGFFADGGTLAPGKFGIVGEEGPELVFGGPAGKTIINQEQFSNARGNGGNTYNIDARGADQGAVARIEQALIALAGPGVTESSISNAQLRGSL